MRYTTPGMRACRLSRQPEALAREIHRATTGTTSNTAGCRKWPHELAVAVAAAEVVTFAAGAADAVALAVIVDVIVDVRLRVI